MPFVGGVYERGTGWWGSAVREPAGQAVAEGLQQLDHDQQDDDRGDGDVLDEQAGEGTDDGKCGTTDNDAFHAAVCRLTAAGVTVAVSTGERLELFPIAGGASRRVPGDTDRSHVVGWIDSGLLVYFIEPGGMPTKTRLSVDHPARGRVEKLPRYR